MAAVQNTNHPALFNAYCSFKKLGTFGDGVGLIAYKYRQAASHAREKYRTWLKVKNNVKHGDALKGHPGWLINLYASFNMEAEEAAKAEEADADAASEDAKPPAPPPTQHASGSSPAPLQDTSPAQLQATLPAPPSTQLHRKHQNTPGSSPTPLQSTSPAPLQNASPAQVHHADSAAGANKAVARKHPLFAFRQQTEDTQEEASQQKETKQQNEAAQQKEDELKSAQEAVAAAEEELRRQHQRIETEKMQRYKPRS